MQRNSEKYIKMQCHIEKCREIQWNAEKCSEIQRNAEKCREMHWNADMPLWPSWHMEMSYLIWHSLRSYHDISLPDPWKWKWSNGVGNSRKQWNWYNLMYITNNVKSNKKINETAQTANFTDVPLIWLWFIMGPNYANANAFFSVAKIPCESWRLADSKNVMVVKALYSYVFRCHITSSKEGSAKNGSASTIVSVVKHPASGEGWHQVKFQ